MTDKKGATEKKISVDPELTDAELTCLGGEEHYDQKAVETVPFDKSQFELPDDFEVEESDDND